MITIHPARADDFSTLGLGALTPTETPVEEMAGGMYQLTITHPMDERGKWLDIVPHNIVKAPAPVRETPEFVIEEASPGQTVTRQIYKVQTPSGKRLHLRQKGSLSAKIITMYKPGTEVVRHSVSGDWARVTVCKGGAAGYMWADYLQFVRTETETVPGSDKPGRVILPRQTREQLFRITRPEKDDAAGLIRAKALHITYDLAGNAIRGELELDNVPANQAVERILAQANDEHPFAVYCGSTKPVSGDFTGKSVAAALWGDDGVVQQIGGRLIRDNFDIYIMDDEARDLGVEIRHGKNMTGAVAYEDASGTVTRIIPVGKNKDGSRLMLDGTPYVESQRAAEIPVVRSKVVEYDVQVGSDGIATVAAAREKLRELALADFEGGADGALVGLDVDFVALENTVEYAQYADLQTIHMYDTVHVISGRSGIRAGVRMTGYVFDAIRKVYQTVTLGDVAGMESTVYGYDIADGSTPGTKLVNNSVAGAKLATGSITARNIQAGAISTQALAAGSVTAEKLAAGSVTADKIEAGAVDTQTLVAGSVTAEKIAAGAVSTQALAAGSVTAEKIAAGAVTATQLDAGSVTADKIVAGSIGADRLKAYLITAESGLIANSAIGTAQIADGSITTAKVAELSADVIKAGTLSAERLLLVGDDGLIYRINATSAGLTAAQLTEEKYRQYIDGTVIVAKSLTAAQIAARTITGNEIAANAVKAANIDVAELFASEATIAQLNAADISGNKYIRLAVEGVKIGGTNLLKGTQDDTWEAYTAGLHYVRPCAELAALGVAAGDVLTYSLNLKVDKPTQLRMIMTKSTSDDRVVDVRGAWVNPGEGRAWVSAEVPAEAGYVRMYIASEGGTAVDGYWKGEKLEKGNKATDWSPAPEDPAKALSTGTTVLIDDEQFNVRTKVASFDIIDDASGEDEELVRIDSDGLTAKDGTFETVHSDSVVGTQAAMTVRPANAGAMQAILDDLSNRFLLGMVSINASDVSGGEFSLSGVHGNGTVVITGGTFNSWTLNNCRVMVRVQQAKFSTSGTAVSATASIAHVLNCTIDAGMGLNLNRFADVILDDCTGTCTTLAGLSYSSVLRVSGSSVPYGVLGTVTGEVYSPLAFTAAPSAPSVETVQTATLNASTTRTWNGGWLSGDALYQGKTGSDGSLRRGCMWFDLSAISGKTIIGATLTLKRYDGIGGGGSVAVGIYGTTAASASGTPAVGTKYASVSMANGATKSVDVTAAVQALAAGSAKGLMIYDTQTGTYSSKNYTYGYSKFYGSGQSAKPVLKVTYK